MARCIRATTSLPTLAHQAVRCPDTRHCCDTTPSVDLHSHFWGLHTGNRLWVAFSMSQVESRTLALRKTTTHLFLAWASIPQARWGAPCPGRASPPAVPAAGEALYLTLNNDFTNKYFERRVKQHIRCSAVLLKYLKSSAIGEKQCGYLILVASTPTPTLKPPWSLLCG